MIWSENISNVTDELNYLTCCINSGSLDATYKNIKFVIHAAFILSHNVVKI